MRMHGNTVLSEVFSERKSLFIVSIVTKNTFNEQSHYTRHFLISNIFFEYFSHGFYYK